MSERKGLTGPEALAALVLLPVMLWLAGFAGSTLLGWFVVPPFGAPELSTAEACGLWVFGILVRCYDEQRSFADIVARGMLLPPFLLGIGAVVHLFV